MLIYDTNLDEEAKVEEVIHQEGWHWPANTAAIRHIIGTLPITSILLTLRGIQHGGSLTEEVNSQLKAVGMHLEEGNLQSWWRSIWYPNHIPKCAIIQWLACRGRLNTEDRLYCWGMITDQSCILCQEDDETISHLFFVSLQQEGLEENM